MNGVAGGRTKFPPFAQFSHIAALDRRAFIHGIIALAVTAAFLTAGIALLLHLYPPNPNHHAVSWMLGLRGGFVLPPLILFSAISSGVAFVPRSMRLAASLTTLGLTLWMTYELAAVLFAAPDTRGLTTELAIDALVVLGVTAYLFAGLREHRRLIASAERDHLTGLLNRAGANRAWNELPPNTLITLAVIDLNELKTINDQHGHEAGDNLLLSCAHQLRQICGNDGVAIRWGGDEFLLALPNHTPEQAREQLEQAAAGITFGIGELPVWAIGTTQAKTGPALHEAMQRADAAMYQHKATQYHQDHHRAPHQR